MPSGSHALDVLSEVNSFATSLHNIEEVDATKYFVRDTSSRRWHSYKLCKQWFNKDVWRYSFTNRQVDLWNSLPVDIVEAPTMDMLKARLD